nr:FAD-dependent oxidoreductase [Anaerolineae bacterium]
MSKKIIVIGGGPAGLEAAKAAAQAGARVTLVSDSPLGGRAGWDSLVPSKVWLTAADACGSIAGAETLGLTRTEQPQPDAAAILSRLKTVAEQWSSQQRHQIHALGLEVLNGVAAFESATDVVVKNGEGQIVARLAAEVVIIATGSVPFFPPNLKPDGKRIVAPRFMSQLQTLPPSITVIGAGPTGSEFVYLFNRLGVNVTWLVDQYGVLPTFTREAGRLLAEVLVERGVNLVAGQMAAGFETDEESVTVVTADGQRYPAAMAFLAIGRSPDLTRLNLEAAGLSIAAGQAPRVDDYGRTDVPYIYAIGDAAGAPMVANRAMAQAWVAGRHAADAKTLPFKPDTAIAATYTEPQVAQVGVVEGTEITTVRVPFSDNLKANLLPESTG